MKTKYHSTKQQKKRAMKFLCLNWLWIAVHSNWTVVVVVIVCRHRLVHNYRIGHSHYALALETQSNAFVKTVCNTRKHVHSHQLRVPFILKTIFKKHTNTYKNKSILCIFSSENNAFLHCHTHERYATTDSTCVYFAVNSIVYDFRVV